MARSRSGTRNQRGPRKPQRRPADAAAATAVQTAEPVARGAVEIPHSITVKDLAELFGVNPADVIRELIKSGIFATINQLIDRDTASLVAGELGEKLEVLLGALAFAHAGGGGHLALEALLHDLMGRELRFRIGAERGEAEGQQGGPGGDEDGFTHGVIRAGTSGSRERPDTGAAVTGATPPRA